MDSAAAALLQRGGVVAWKGRTDPVREMIPLEEARALVCGAVEKLPVETVELLDAPTFFELYRRWLRENPEAAAGQIE